LFESPLQFLLLLFFPFPLQSTVTELCCSFLGVYCALLVEHAICHLSLESKL
jgi:hypothetical protein